MVVKGEIRGQEDLWIDGQLEGTIDLPGRRLTVGPNAKVRAKIRAREVEIQGLVEGDVEAAERIIIRRNARLTGDLKMAGVVIEDGAYFKGSIDITQGQAAAAASPNRNVPVSSAETPLP
jgi:cytoskeletal protein CcmA (bactofilin family)